MVREQIGYMNQLIENRQARSSALVIGAASFTVGFIVQVACSTDMMLNSSTFFPL